MNLYVRTPAIFNHMICSLIQTLGKVGRVLEVYSDGDVNVDVRGSKWTFNPACLSKLDSDGVPLTPGTSGEPCGHAY